MTHVLVATDRTILRYESGDGAAHAVESLTDRPTCVVWDPFVEGRAWCGTVGGGVFRSDDGGATWHPAGLQGERIMTVTPSPAERDLVWAGMEPSAIWRSQDAGGGWERMREMETLPSSSEWSFPPRPDTHHVRWIACHPSRSSRLWVAIEAGALVSTADGGRTWSDRVRGGPYDTHELAAHPDTPDTLRVSAGDGYYESHDAGMSWHTPRAGLDVGYLRSVAIDPGDADVVVVSASTHAHAAYVTGRSDGRLYRRVGDSDWQRVRSGWPEEPQTIAPLLVSGSVSGELWAADERGVHRSTDGGERWAQVLAYPSTPNHLRGLAVRA